MTSRERVLRTLAGTNDDRAARQIWTLPWAVSRYGKELEEIRRDYPEDIAEVPPEYKLYKTPLKAEGDWYTPGWYFDEWGCRFFNAQAGLIGECKDPIVQGEDWTDLSKVHVPEELLSVDMDKINEFCASTDKFVLASDLARPFERLQFIRGTEQLYVDLMLKPDGMMEFFEKMHDFYCRMLTTWAQTNVDGLFFMDDWGSQRSLLINPKLFKEIFKPMYRDYSDIAQKYGKKLFFHSDGYTLSIIPELIDVGVDALNAQIFCIGVEKLAQFRNQITFWGEIDRQHLLPHGSREDIYKAVKLVRDTLYNRGGAIAQCEFGAAAKPENVRYIMEAWSSLD